jgi:DNA-binding protein HU-beta
MTKADIINEISEKTGIEKVVVTQTIETFFKSMKGNMVKGNNIYFRGFGSFILQHRKAKIGRNITKNTSVVIDEHFIPKFKPSKDFIEAVKSSESVKSKLK